ncbi:cobaltochelatase subunit CobN [Eilatimonas milleporae]|uniref:Cobaltochelatase CobN subunit n=1 Tax=Eilatimonas milleporae TaxID=911205 RepID=A0A3M0CCC8_9PROT|nr:cobaltochelatase subunit CobN [Eilatimonas milleporae]RMB00683.1 cobaltochelatase CobN subunit [Eilatimonas milleporae]
MRINAVTGLLLSVIAALALPTGTAWAKTLVGIVSERNSAAAAAAAALFRDRSDAEIRLRTPRQLAALSDRQIAALLDAGDALLIAGVFGDDAGRLARIVEQIAPDIPVFAVSATRALVLKSRGWDGRPVTLAEIEDTASAATPWQRANAYWQARGPENLANLFAFLIAGQGGTVPDPDPVPAIRFSARQGAADAPLIALVDYDTGDQAGNIDLHDALCTALQKAGLACLSVFADWGLASAEALERLRPHRPAGVIMMQDFAVGGSHRARADRALEALDVPVLKAIRLNEKTETAWRADADGLPVDSVYYRVAMPELSGSGQPMVLAAGAPPRLDPVSGIEIRVTRPVAAEVAGIARRMAAWVRLRNTRNADKRLAIIYYNHPPGRHNIGADNLDVPASLLAILNRLKAEGYDVGDLPDTPAALLALIQERAVNLPENDAALKAMGAGAFTLPVPAYRTWFSGLPARVQAEMTDGPLAALQLRVRAALDDRAFDRARRLVTDAVHDMAFVIEGAPARFHARAEDLLDQLDAAYMAAIDGAQRWPDIRSLSAALMRQGIEGLRGWGLPPGTVMTVGGRFVFPGLRFGNILIAPQPPRGWEVNEEVLHANMSVPPTHQYLAFYRWLHDTVRPHAMIHLGRHSTYEFLPGPRVGLAGDTYSRLIAGDVPGLYPYIVDGVGEGLQAKRRGLAVMVDHLTPPLKATPFYDQLLGLRQLVETFEAADPSPAGDAARTRALSRIRAQVTALGIRDALISELEAEHGGAGTMDFETVDPDLLVHEVGHFLTDMQEDFMPLGLHVFGQPWSEAAVDTMLASMGDAAARESLTISPDREMAALMAGLDGRFILPGKGNDPLRAPDALPTGRNFFGLDASLVPNLIAWDLGAAMARQATDGDGTEAVVLWASDTVRDGGVMMAFGLNLMGVKPVWNARGILQGLERLPLPPGQRRRDVTFVASGLFRDLYGVQMAWLDKAGLLALDGSSLVIGRDHPHLVLALEAALAPLGELRAPGGEPLDRNEIAAHWVAALRDEKAPAPVAGRRASLRVFGPAPGRYGAGVNRLAERSGAWRDRAEIARSYIARMGHAYGADVSGAARQTLFRDRLALADQSFLGRASNLYGLVDNNDAFDYLGGLNMAVEAAGGTPARGFVVDVSDPASPDMTPLASAIVREVRGRQLNPAWIRALMAHGYAGARTMNTAFFENLWGWEVTDPALFSDRIWAEAKAVYLDDRHDLGVDTFLDTQAARPVKANILAIMLVAAHKGYWQADEATVAELAEAFARVVAAAGLPGSGHTRPDHPMLDWIAGKLPDDLAEVLAAARDAARGDTAAQATAPETVPETVRELKPVPRDRAAPSSPLIWVLALAAAVLLGGGILIGRRTTV